MALPTWDAFKRVILLGEAVKDKRPAVRALSRESPPSDAGKSLFSGIDML